MSVLLFNMLSPFLLVSNLSRNLAFDKLGEVWPLVFWAFVHIFTGYLLGKLIVWTFRPRKEYHSSIVCVLGYTNSVSLPLIMIESIVRSEFFVNEVNALERATGFFFMYSMAWNIAFYSFGYSYLAGSSLGTPESSSDQDEGADPRPPTFTQRAAFTWKMMYTNPNMVGMFISFIIGLIPFLKEQLFTEGTVLRPLMQSIQLIGGGSVPLGSLVMAANVALSIRRNFSSEGRQAATSDTGFVVQWVDPTTGRSEDGFLPSLVPTPTEMFTGASHPMGAGAQHIALDEARLAQEKMQAQRYALFSRLAPFPGAPKEQNNTTFNYEKDLHRVHSNHTSSGANSIAQASTFSIVEGEDDGLGDTEVGFAYPPSLSYVASSDASLEEEETESRNRNGEQRSFIGGDSRLGGGRGARLASRHVASDEYSYEDEIEMQSLQSSRNITNHSLGRDSPESSSSLPTNTVLSRVFSVDNGELLVADRARGLKMSNSGRFYYQDVEIFPPKFDGTDQQDVDALPGSEFNPHGAESKESFRARLRPRLREVELPSPILPPFLSAAIVFSKLVLLPILCYSMFFGMDLLGFSAFVPEDKVFRMSMLLLFLTPSAESILVILSKQNLVRQAMAISLIYVYQYLAALVTIALGVTASILLIF